MCDFLEKPDVIFGDFPLVGMISLNQSYDDKYQVKYFDKLYSIILLTSIKYFDKLYSIILLTSIIQSEDPLVGMISFN